MKKNSIKTLLAENEYLKDLLISMPGHVYWLDHTNHYLGCNHEQAISLGLSHPQDIIGKTPHDFSPKEIADQLIANNNLVMKSKKKMVIDEIDCRRGSNTVRYFHTEKVPLFNKNGEVIGLLGISSDMTQEKQKKESQLENLAKMTINIIGRNDVKDKDAFELARDLRDFFENIIAHMPGHVYWKNRDGVLLGCNNNMLRFFGIGSREELEGKTDYDIQPKEAADIITKIDQQVMSAGHEIFIEEPHPHDPCRAFLTHKAPIRDRNNQIIGILGMSMDISERKKMEHDLQEAKETAEIASAAKTEFIKNMSHDIRTPLNGIMGMAQLLEMKETDPKKHAYVNGLLESSRRLTALLTEILELVRMESGERPIEYTTINLPAMLDDVVKLLMPQASCRRLTLSYHYDKKLPRELISDKLRIHRIILNLVSNALKFTDKGSITINLSLDRIEENQVWVSLSVQDTGIGIPKEKTSAIFERFTKLKSSYNRDDYGSGLGLYIVKMMVSELNGKISVQSTVNEGSTFTCLIPFKKPAKQEQTLTHLQQDKKEQKQHLPKKVLLIEDNKICQIAENQLLAELNCKIDLADNAMEALTLLQQNQYDIILLDIGLPDIDGITLAETIRTDMNIDTPIVATTAHAWDTNKYHEVKINHHLQKPITLEQFQNVIEEYAK